MKELTIEEKAKRYDKAIEKLRSLHNDYDTVSTLIDIKEELEQIFPELKESDDDRIRKWIINEIKIKHHNLDEANVDFVDKAIAWLEKQGEQKEIDYNEELKKCKANPLYFFDKYVKVKLKKQKPTDEEMKILLQTEYEKGKADAIEAAMESVTKDKESAIKFLKSAGIINDNGTLAKEYVVDNVEQNSAWSEGDNAMLDNIVAWIEGKWGTLGGKVGGKEAYISWLKSLKERYTWKPSKEQMHYLSWIANVKLGSGVVEQEVSKHLNELYDDLKKLREK